MKIKLFTLVLALAFCGVSQAQDWEFGVFLGPAQYQGDLSKAQVTWKYTRLQGGVIARYNFTPKISFKGQIFYGNIKGDDKFWAGKFTEGLGYKPKDGDPKSDKQGNYYYRLKRNLNFTSNVFEIALGAEYNIFKFIPGSTRYRWTPYVTTGFGMFHFNPKTTDENGNTVKLVEQYTENEKIQRLIDKGKGYSLWSFCVPVGVGVKYNLGNLWSVSFEICGRKTFTDYLDDVHYNYLGPSTDPLVQKITGVDLTAARKLSDRSYEVVNPTTGQKFSSANLAAQPVKTPDQLKVVRGDSRDKDTYIFTGFTISKTFRSYGCANF